MNSEAERLVLSREQETSKLGVCEQRRRALRTLKLKTVVKESHCTPIYALDFNRVQAQYSNIFATVGKTQATIYDDQHMADYIAVVAQFNNLETEHSPGGELRTCAWLHTAAVIEHAHGDSYLAVSGADTTIQIISIAECCVLFQLRGHKKEVVDLVSCARRPTLLVSLAKDGELRIWDYCTETCIACVSTDACSLAFHPSGDYLLTGRKGGGLQRWRIPASAPSVKSVQKAKKAKVTAITELDKQAFESEGAASHCEAVDCIQFLDDDRLASKSTDGRCIITDASTNKQLASWKVPSCSPAGGIDSRCRFSITSDGALLSVGNSKGDTHVYETSTGEKLTTVSPIKVSGHVKACGISEDARHLLVAMGNGFIFRYESQPGKDEGTQNKTEPDTTPMEEI